MHITVADMVIEKFKQSGRNVTVTRDYQVTRDDIADKSLVVCLGGDGTFLKTASTIPTSRIPVLGVNTDPTRSVGHLCSRKIPFKTREEETDRMLKYLDRENFEFFYRQRLCLG